MVFRLNLWFKRMEEQCDMGRDTSHLILYKKCENEVEALGAWACYVDNHAHKCGVHSVAHQPYGFEAGSVSYLEAHS